VCSSDLEAGGVVFGDHAWEQVGVVAVPPGTAVEGLLPSPVHAAPQVFVATVPQGQGGVRGQSGDVFTCLGLELAPQRLFLGVGGTCQGEVLPDEDATFVTHVVEVLGLVDTTAPDPQHVHVRIDGLVDTSGQAVTGDAGEEEIGRASCRERV